MIIILIVIIKDRIVMGITMIMAVIITLRMVMIIVILLLIAKNSVCNFYGEATLKLKIIQKRTQ